MYLQILKFVTPKRAAITVAVLAIFAAGWTTNGWRYKTKMAQRQAAIVSDYAKQRQSYMLKYREQQQIDEAAAEELSADLDSLRVQRRALQEKLRTAAVVKVGVTCNPFAKDFVKVWNNVNKESQ